MRTILMALLCWCASIILASNLIYPIHIIAYRRYYHSVSFPLSESLLPPPLLFFDQIGTYNNRRTFLDLQKLMHNSLSNIVYYFSSFYLFFFCILLGQWADDPMRWDNLLVQQPAISIIGDGTFFFLLQCLFSYRSVCSDTDRQLLYFTLCTCYQPFIFSFCSKTSFTDLSLSPWWKKKGIRSVWVVVVFASLFHLRRILLLSLVDAILQSVVWYRKRCR